jgi:hypothetical protein
MNNIKIEEIKIVIASNRNETDIAFDKVIEWVYEGELMDNYRVLSYENPVEYELTEKEF